MPQILCDQTTYLYQHLSIKPLLAMYLQPLAMQIMCLLDMMLIVNPYKTLIIEADDKVFRVRLSDREEQITIDRLKSAYMHCGKETVATPPRRSRPHTNHGPPSSPSNPSTCESETLTTEHYSRYRRALVVVCLPRPMEGMGDSNFQIFSQNCQFHHRRMESFIYIYIILSTTVSFLEDTILFLQVSFFHFVYISIFSQVHLACVICI